MPPPNTNTPRTSLEHLSLKSPCVDECLFHQNYIFNSFHNNETNFCLIENPLYLLSSSGSSTWTFFSEKKVLGTLFLYYHESLIKSPRNIGYLYTWIFLPDCSTVRQKP